MPTDREIAEQAKDFQARARDYRLMDLPGYMAWSKRRLIEGESAELMANLDATGMWLLPEDVEKITEADFEDLLSELKTSPGEE